MINRIAVLILFLVLLSSCIRRTSNLMTCPLSIEEAKEKGILIREYECHSPVVSIEQIRLEVDWAILHHAFHYRNSRSDKVEIIDGNYYLVVHFKNKENLNKMEYSKTWRISNNWDGLLQYNCARFRLNHIPQEPVNVYIENIVRDSIDQIIRYDTIGHITLTNSDGLSY